MTKPVTKMTRRLFKIIASLSLLMAPQAYSEVTSPSAELQSHLKRFESAVLKHDRASLMQTLDPKYVREQHDDMLKGRTQQFIDELLSGRVVTDSSFSQAKLDQIVAIHRVKLKEIGERQWSVVYLIVQRSRSTTDKHKEVIRDVTSEVTLEVNAQVDAGGTLRYGLAGSVG